MRVLVATTAGAGHFRTGGAVRFGLRRGGQRGPRCCTSVVRLIDDALAALGSRGGVSGLLAGPTFSFVPGCMEDPDKRVDAAVHRFRDQPVEATGGEVGQWWGDAEAPLVHVERYWPQHAVMPYASAMVGHGGFGTTMVGLTHGVPMVVVPLFALAQHYNAQAVARTGAGIALGGGPAAIVDLGPLLERVLHEAAYLTRAQDVAAEIARLPLASRIVELLEEIAQR